MYSDMSSRTMAASLSNRNCASARASSVLPTPVGPRNLKLPMGRPGSCMPAAGQGAELQLGGFLQIPGALGRRLVLAGFLERLFGRAQRLNRGQLVLPARAQRLQPGLRVGAAFGNRGAAVGAFRIIGGN